MLSENVLPVDCYVLKIYLDDNIITNSSTIDKYKKKISEIQKTFNYLGNTNYDVESGQVINSYPDAGFDLFVPQDYTINSNTLSKKINHGISCSMTFNNKPTAYYLYPRSSMGSKTPLRLSNSVGIIDAGYRGHITGLVDNINISGEQEAFTVNLNDRLMQICGPNIMYPIYPVLVNNISDLGVTTRGSGGFGSTGR